VVPQKQSDSTISVVIPVKDDAQALRRCLEALRPQLGPDDELIVVDNGSRDSTEAVAAEFGGTIVSVDGGGIPAASAAGYDCASRQIIARLDADCVPPADWLTAIRTYFSEHPDTGAVTGWAHFYDGPRLLRPGVMVAYLGAYYVTLFPALGHVPIFGSNCAFYRAAWIETRDEVHRDDEGVHDDLDLSFHIGISRSVRFDSSLRMGISMRPFFDASAFLTRLHRGLHSVVVHWPSQLPWLRWYRHIVRPR